MDTMEGFSRAQAAKARGDRHKVFDWELAAKLIKDQKPSQAGAGLAGDWGWTGGTIYRAGAIVDDEYTYLMSNHATPELEMDGETVDCFRYQDETPGWGSDTKWPPEARAILGLPDATEPSPAAEEA